MDFLSKNKGRKRNWKKTAQDIIAEFRPDPLAWAAGLPAYANDNDGVK